MRVLLFITAKWNCNTATMVRTRLLANGLMDRGATLATVAPDEPAEGMERAAASYAWLDLGLAPKAALMQAVQVFQPEAILGVTEGLANLVVETSWAVGCASVLDLHSIGIVEILELGRGYGSRLARSRNSLRWLWSVRKANAVTVVSPTMVPVIRRLNRNVLPAVGGADLQKFSPLGPRIELGPSDRIQVLYAGNMLRWQGVGLLLVAASRLIAQGEPFDFTLIGSFGSIEQLTAQYRSLVDSGHLRIMEPVDYEEMPVHLRSADILVIPRPSMLTTRLAFPQKMSDYMASGGAIVATDLKPHRYAIEDGQTGILCKPEAEALAEALLRLRSPELRQKLGANARRFAEAHFSADYISGIIWSALENAIRNSGR